MLPRDCHTQDEVEANILALEDKILNSINDSATEEMLTEQSIICDMLRELSVRAAACSPSLPIN